MEIADKKVVGIHYKLTDGSGQLIDSSEGQNPLIFIFGLGHIIPGLEKELMGKKSGDKLNAVIPPQEGYGERDDQMIQEIPKSQFESPEGIQIGMQFEVQTELGPLVVSVSEVKDETVTIDGNHPLAGMTLHFEVEVTEVREATQEELEHGHVHGPGGHNH